MAHRLRGFLARRLSGVGPQLQVFWHKTLTSGQSLKRALSPPVSPRSGSFPTTKPGDDPSQETYLPIFNIEQEASASPAHKGSKPNSTATGAIIPGYANAATQTEQSSSESAPESMFEDSQSNNGCDAGFCHAEEATFADENFEVDEVEPSTRSEVGDCDVAPEIPEGPSRVLLTNYDEKDCLAILITKEMVGHANAVKEDSSKLESLKEKLIEVRRKIELTHVEVNYCEGLIQSSGSPIVIEDLRREIAERQGTLREDEARRDSLEEDVIILKRNLAYSESLLRSMTLRLLEDANLLETPEEHLHEEVDRCQDNDSERRSEISYGSNVSIDQLYRRAVDEEVQERSRELREAEENFERRHEVYEQEKRRFHQKLLEGTCALSETAFDLCYLEDTRERTRELGAAEDAFEEAFARMKKLGPNQWDQESGFITDEYDDVRDGYAMSREDGEVADVTDRLIHKWLENVPNAEVLSSGADAEDDTDDELREDDEEGLENCDIRSARMSDSVSCCDMSRGRKRIDRWRAIAGRER